MNDNIIESLKKGEEKYVSYINSFIARFVYGIAEFEKMDYEDISTSLMISDAFLAFNYLVENADGYISPNTIRNVFEMMCNNQESYVTGFRKYDVIAAQGKIVPSPAWAIQSNLSNVIYQYNHLDNTTQFEKEAYLHIEMSRIQPFEDCNKRVSRLIMAYNLMYNGYPPAIIPISEQGDYYKSIENRDFSYLTKVIEESSKKEGQIIKMVLNTNPIILPESPRTL
jgi:Fic family protein